MVPKLHRVRGLKLVDCRLGNSIPATANCLLIRKLFTSMPQIVVQDSEPIFHCQKFPNTVKKIWLLVISSLITNHLKTKNETKIRYAK